MYCNETRFGIAASTAVELAVSLIQHPDGYVFHPSILLDTIVHHSVNAPAPPPQTGSDVADPSTSGSVLGLVPHQLRGFLAQFRNMPIVGAAYDKCTGCSETVSGFLPVVCCSLTLEFIFQVLRAYEEQGFDMMLKAFNETGYLEKLTGLDQLYEQGEGALESVDWDEEDEDDT